MGSDRSALEFPVRILNASPERGITVLPVNQTEAEAFAVEIAGEPISAPVDTILFMRYVESSVEMNGVISVVKTRGRSYSNQLEEFRITSRGFEIAKIHSRKGTVLTGAGARKRKLAMRGSYGTSRR